MLARFVLLASVALLIAGCGFKLRSYELETNVQSFAITGKTRAAIVDPLRSALLQIGVEEVAPETADMVIQLLNDRGEQRSVSTAGQLSAAEYELDYAVEYELLNAEGVRLADPVWIERRRVYRVDRDNIVGSSEERTILQRELLQDLVGQLIRAMDLVSRQAAAGTQSTSGS